MTVATVPSLIFAGVSFEKRLELLPSDLQIDDRSESHLRGNGQYDSIGVIFHCMPRIYLLHLFTTCMYYICALHICAIIHAHVYYRAIFITHIDYMCRTHRATGQAETRDGVDLRLQKCGQSPTICESRPCHCWCVCMCVYVYTDHIPQLHCVYVTNCETYTICVRHIDFHIDSS